MNRQTRQIAAASGFFPNLDLPSVQETQVRRLVELSWLLMGEGFPILEDIEGAAGDPDLLACLRISLAEFLAELDQRLTGADIAADHRLAVALERGTTEIRDWSGAEFAEAMGLTAPADPTLIPKLQALWAALLADYPIELVDPLQPDTQGKVLRALRDWTKLCDAAGVDTEFLKEMMKAV